VAAVWALTLARLRHRPAPWLLLVVGVAVALALPVVSAATGLVVATRALSHAVDQLPPGERTVVATYGGTPDPAVQRHDDAIARDGLTRLTAAPIHHQVLYGELADTAGDTYRLGASDNLADEVRVTSGRLPTTCLPARCEVLLTGSDHGPRLDSALGLVIVGTGVRTDPLLLPGTLDPGADALLLLGADPDALQRLSRLEHFPKGSGWVAALDVERIVSLGVPAYADLSRTVSDGLALSVRSLVLSVPDDALVREDARASSSRGRFALVGGATAVLALGFALVAAVGLRREHRDVAGLLRRRGAARPAVAVFAVAGTGAAVVAGTFAGAVVGWVSAWALARGTPLHPPASSVATTALLDSLPTVALLALIAVTVTTAVLSWPESRPRAAWRVV
jgi:hypothetical protein